MINILCLYSGNKLFKAYLFIVLFDILLGTLKAFSTGTVSSQINKQGITKHITIVLFIMFMIWLFEMLNLKEFSDGFILFYIGSYMLSVIENLGEMGLPIPDWLGKYFITIQEQGDNNNEIKGN